MKRVLLVECQPIANLGFQTLLKDCYDSSCVGVATDLPSLRTWLSKKKGFDVVVIDIDMSGHDGLEALRLLRDEAPRVPVLVFTARDPRHCALHLLRLGAAGYLRKHAPVEELLTAIHRVAGGKKYIPMDIAERLSVLVCDPTGLTSVERLTTRELEVMEQIALGRTVTDIAKELSLSPKTVSTYKTRLLEKLDLRNDLELVRYALEQGLVEPLLVASPVIPGQGPKPKKR
jgi:two-component system, NarL family, invasion response regulator UvrY